MLFKRKTLAALALSTLLTLSSSSLAFANNVSLTIQNGQIKDVLAALSAISGKSIITDGSVKGLVSIDLNDVPFEDALDLVTRSNGLAYRNIHDVIVVSSIDNMGKNFGTVSVFKLQFAKAADIVTALKGVVKAEGLTADDVTNSIIFSGNSSEEQKLRTALQQLDVATKQITLEAKIIAVNLEDTKKFGLNWNWSEIPSSTDSDTNYGGTIHWGHGYTSTFQATLSAMITDGKAKILATPRILTIPGKAANIFIGDHIPVLTKEISDGTTSTSITYVDAGIKLNYTPIVSDDDFITSVVHTEVSTATLVSEIENYKITSRSADTTVRMRNGETLIIGGLINEEESKSMQAVPLLCKIPVLGELFKYRNNSKKKTEVMMILTPYVTSAGESPAIYNPKVANMALDPVPSSDEDEEAKAAAREKRRAERAQAAAREQNGGKESFRERVDRILAEDAATNNN